jgi:hypothetical protein
MLIINTNKQTNKQKLFDSRKNIAQSVKVSVAIIEL